MNNLTPDEMNLGLGILHGAMAGRDVIYDKQLPVKISYFARQLKVKRTIIRAGRGAPAQREINHYNQLYYLLWEFVRGYFIRKGGHYMQLFDKDRASIKHRVFFYVFEQCQTGKVTMAAQ